MAPSTLLSRDIIVIGKCGYQDLLQANPAKGSACLLLFLDSAVKVTQVNTVIDVIIVFHRLLSL